MNSSRSYLYLHHDLTFRDNEYRWSIDNPFPLVNMVSVGTKYIYTVRTKECILYLSYNPVRKSFLVKDKRHAVKLTLDTLDGNAYVIYYTKPELMIEVEKLAIENMPHIESGDGIVGLVLAAGQSTRFNQQCDKSIPKQLLEISGKPLISHSVEAMRGLDKILIVTNSECYDNIMSRYQGDSQVMVKNIGGFTRIESIYAGLMEIKRLGYQRVNRVIIHDAARPFIKKSHIDKLVACPLPYCQYGLKLTNGLAKLSNMIEPVDRDEYIELCTPVCINLELALFIYDRCKEITQEFIGILDIMDIQYEIIYGYTHELRKITYREDLST